MFDRIFGNYLVESGKLTDKDLETVYTCQEQKSARLGVIAVSEKLMTIEQVEEVNQLQAVCDKRFGDIAVEKGYFNDEQVRRLLHLQGNSFLAFLQSVEDCGFMNMEQANETLLAFQKDKNYTQANMEDFKSCDIDCIVPIYVYEQPSLLQELCGVMVRTVSRLVDYHVFIKQPYIVKDYPFSCFCMQKLGGKHTILTTLSGSSEAMMKAAIGFAGERFIDNEEDSLDALCELINCVNGLFATDLSNRFVDVDMEVPHYQSSEGTLRGESLLCLPMVVCGKEVNLVATLDQPYTL